MKNNSAEYASFPHVKPHPCSHRLQTTTPFSCHPTHLPYHHPNPIPASPTTTTLFMCDVFPSPPYPYIPQHSTLTRSPPHPHVLQHHPPPILTVLISIPYHHCPYLIFINPNTIQYSVSMRPKNIPYPSSPQAMTHVPWHDLHPISICPKIPTPSSNKPIQSPILMCQHLPHLNLIPIYHTTVSIPSPQSSSLATTPSMFPLPPFHSHMLGKPWPNG